jgi:hypothetical protein
VVEEAAAAFTDGRILVMEASADSANRVFTALQQLVISRDGTLRVAQARDEGLVVCPDESEHDLSLQPRGESRQRNFGRSGDYPDAMLELSSLDLGDIAVALEDQTDYEHRWLINPQTGEIVFWTSDTGIDGQTPVDLDDLDLVGIHPLVSWVWYQDMADFAEGITDDQAGRRLARAIRGKGAFRRFKDELHEEYPNLLEAWYAFRDARATRRAVQWLADNSLVDDEAADRFLTAHPDPVLP